jgi:hypothetical protein
MSCIQSCIHSIGILKPPRAGSNAHVSSIAPDTGSEYNFQTVHTALSFPNVIETNGIDSRMPHCRRIVKFPTGHRVVTQYLLYERKTDLI